MQCVNHSGQPASTLCQRCDTALCDGCVAERNGRKFCAACADFVDQRATRRPPRPHPTATSAAAAAAPGDVYSKPPPGDLYPPGLAPAYIYQGPAPGDIYQGPAPADTYQEPAPGDIYQGPAPGDVYQGPPVGGVYQGAAPGLPGAAAVPADTAFSVRGLLAGFIGLIIAAALYYWLYVSLDLRFTWFVLIMALVVAFTARLGAGRAGRDVGLVAAGLFVLSVILGQYLVAKKLHEEEYAAIEIQRQAAAEIRIDGRYTEDEARRLLGYLPEEWAELSANEKTWSLEMLRSEYEEAKAEGYDPRELYDTSYGEEGEMMEPTLTLGAYFGDLRMHFGLWGLLLLAIGCWEAYKIASIET